jgi:ribonuclease BN (tRNA processing enzyme)
MRLTVVGCAGSFPKADSPASAYLVEVDGFTLVIDMGNGALGALQKYIGLYDVDAVFVSHLHADHCIDMCVYAVARKFKPGGPAATIPVYGPAATAERLRRAYESGPDHRELDESGLCDVFDFRTLRPGKLEVGPFRLTVDRVDHPVETYGVRIEHGGATIAYSADSAACPALVELARGADLFLCEACWPDGGDNPPNLHLTGREAGEQAAAAGAERLVLTHISAWADPERSLTEAKKAFGGPVDLASPGAVYTV